MDKTNRRDTTPASKPADGPLTRLVDDVDQDRPSEPAKPRPPQPPETKHEGRDDYASGTPEHDDDREI
jgi:hypothetical protein